MALGSHGYGNRQDLQQITYYCAKFIGLKGSKLGPRYRAGPVYDDRKWQRAELIAKCL